MTGKFEESLFTKGLIKKVWMGCRESKGLVCNEGLVVELLPHLGPKDEGKECILEPEGE